MNDVIVLAAKCNEKVMEHLMLRMSVSLAQMLEDLELRELLNSTGRQTFFFCKYNAADSIFVSNCSKIRHCSVQQGPW